MYAYTTPTTRLTKLSTGLSKLKRETVLTHKTITELWRAGRCATVCCTRDNDYRLYLTVDPVVCTRIRINALVRNDGELRRCVSWLKRNATGGADNNCVLSDQTADAIVFIKKYE